MEHITELKGMLRDAVRRAMQSWPEAARSASDKALREAFLQSPLLAGAERIFLFYGIGIEPETAPLLPLLWEMGKQVYLPRCLPGRRMEARLVLPDCLMDYNSLGIPEPSDGAETAEKDTLDLILVPAVCYDRKGYRLGQGGGYYDRYLADYRGMTVGLCRARLLQERLPREEHDVPVMQILTEDGPLAKEQGGPPVP